MISKHHTSTAALETVDHAELTLVGGGFYLGPDCPTFPQDDPTWGSVFPPPTVPRPYYC